MSISISLLIISSLSISVQSQHSFDIYLLSKIVNIMTLENVVSESNYGIFNSQERIHLQDNYFMNPETNWVDSSYRWYWNNKWSQYNCYSFALSRYDVVPYYYPYAYDPSPYRNRWYEPGQISQNSYFSTRPTAQDIASVVAEDLEVMGFSNISTSQLNTTIELEDNQELIAVRVTPSTEAYDYHFMKFNKNDGYWYHKPSDGAVLRYKYPLSESVIWTNETINSLGNVYGGVTYAGDIWLIKYTPSIISTSSSFSTNEIVYCDNNGDKLIILDIEQSGYYSIVFGNINGFSAILYSSDWDLISAVSYDPIEAVLNEGLYYLVLKNYRYSDNVYITICNNEFYNEVDSTNLTNSIAICEFENIIIGTLTSENELLINYIPIL